jgi:hypothetical protein
VGQAILESYSRVIESLAYTVLSRIEDVLYVDSMTKNPSLAVSGRRFSLDSLQVTEQTSPHSEDGVRSMNSSGTPPSMTLSDFMGWSSTNDLKRTNSTGDLYDLKEKDEKSPKKHYYLDKLEYLNAIRSPIGRH